MGDGAAAREEVGVTIVAAVTGAVGVSVGVPDIMVAVGVLRVVI